VLGAGCLIGGLALLWLGGLPRMGDYVGYAIAAGRVAPEPGAIAPPFALETLDGGQVALDDLRGSPVVVNFWATWCGPCRVEMPDLQRLHEALGPHGLRVIGVNLDEPPETVTPWLDTLSITYTIALDRDGAVASTYRLRGQPQTVIVSPDGIVAHILYGAASYEALHSAVAPWFELP
jgi:peroxiredoxin